jgi:hypothetical protein
MQASQASFSGAINRVNLISKMDVSFVYLFKGAVLVIANWGAGTVFPCSLNAAGAA